MPVTAETQAILDLNAGVPPFNGLSREEAREALAALRPQREPESVAQVHDLVIPGPAGDIPARSYLHFDNLHDLPTVVYFHGGGWVSGDLDSSDAVCRALCNRSGMNVLSVGYRLAPGARFPAAAEDAYAATTWINCIHEQQGGRTDRIAVAGDSSGGNLAAVVSQMARDRSGPQIVAQVLIYPVTNFNFETESYRKLGADYGLSETVMRSCWRQYLNVDSEGTQPYASPLRAADFSRLPRSLTITAEYDPLRDEGEAYAAALSAAGNQSSCTRYDGVIHGFVSAFAAVPEGNQALDQIAAELRSAFGRD
ncbi:MAG: alpha/beta hydrolase [Chloroflexi bacterium]|nr:alpha/beta hydrolase [Chloroflexota bacterium]MYJ58552.1 alpha/beta hydrolase [Chloroflexota bacterium]